MFYVIVYLIFLFFFFFFSSRRRHTRFDCDWSSDVCSSDLDAPARMQPDDLLRLNARNAKGDPVPLSTFATTKWVKGAQQTVRYNGYPAVRIEGSAAPGFSSRSEERRVGKECRSRWSPYH